MNASEREKWLEGAKNELGKLADELFAMEQSNRKDTSKYKEKLELFLKRLSVYETALKKHNLLSEQEEKTA